MLGTSGFGFSTDGIDEVWTRNNNFRPLKVLADYDGYYIIFPEGESGTKASQACYNNWMSKGFRLFGKLLKIEMEKNTGENDKIAKLW